MTTAVRIWENDGVYHIINRGVEKRSIFLESSDYHRFLKALVFYQQDAKLTPFSFNNFEYDQVSPNKRFIVITYCLMPNHFHLMLKQVVNKGIIQGMSQLLNSYVKYFNTKYDRVGPLFQGRLKSYKVETDEQYVHLARYILLNPYSTEIVENLEIYPWSAYKEYFAKTDYQICFKNDILAYFASRDKFKKFILDHADYARSRKLNEKLFME